MNYYLASLVLLIPSLTACSQSEPDAGDFAMQFTESVAVCNAALSNMSMVSARRGPLSGGRIGNASAMVEVALEDCEASQTGLERLSAPNLPSPFMGEVDDALQICRTGVGNAVEGLRSAKALLGLGRDFTPSEGKSFVDAVGAYQNVSSDYLEPCYQKGLMALADGGTPWDVAQLQNRTTEIFASSEDEMNSVY